MLKLALIGMEWNVVHWFQYWCWNSKTPWKGFAKPSMRRFENKGGLVCEGLASFRQKGRVEEYIQEFELLVVQGKIQKTN